MRADRVYGTELIPLKRMDYSEADRIITVFTPARGKLRVLARGVRKSTSRMSGHLELFCLSHAMLARGRDLDTITQATTVESFRALRESLVSVSHAYHFGELVDAFLPDRDPHHDVFVLLRDSLRALDSQAVLPDLIARHFELHLLAAIGFRPELTNCVLCAALIEPGANGLSVSLGGIVCPSCIAREPTAAPLATETLKLLRFLQRKPDDQTIGLQVPGSVLRDAERVLKRQLEFVLERRLRAADFVRQVAETAAPYAS